MSTFFKSCHDFEDYLFSKGIDHNSIITRSFGKSGAFIIYNTRNGLRQLSISRIGITYINKEEADQIIETLKINGYEKHAGSL